MTDVQVRCTLRSANNSPADDCINTFAVSLLDSPGDAVQVGDAFDHFYNTVQPTSGEALSEYINDSMFRTNGLMVEIIEDPATVPNAPYFTETYDLAGANSNPLPQEVAMVLSFVTNDYLTDPNPGRHRGRVYIGPLTVDAMTDGGLNLPAVPSSNFKAVLMEAATELRDELLADALQWCIWSRAGNFFNGVQGGWVDNEFDTQRRRGREASVKSYWG